ncbi:MAG TPA: electron transfer flavoprotein subunit beta/FixA family protein [bacterium]|nr:electron transfer flavoprotein subunit beta/FixA family protein [bacterium]
MNIIVLVKQVPDTETRIKLKAGSTDIDREGINMVLNPYDEFAVEEAIKIKEAGGGSVVIITAGEAKAEEAVRTALAMGADRAIRLDGAEFAGADSYSTAKALAKAISAEQYDLILCGKQAVDDDSVQVGTLVAAMLGIPSVNMVTKLEVAGGSMKASREIEGGHEVVEVPTPCVITAQKGLNEPRYPSLPGIMKAKKKELKAVALGALGLSADEVGAAGAKSAVVELSLPPERKAGQVFEGEAAEIVPKVVKLLRDEAKVV